MYTEHSTNPCRFRAIAAALLLSVPSLVTAQLPLGSIGQTELQINTGNSVQIVCGGFVRNMDAETAAEMDLFDKCGEMVQTANAIIGNEGSTDKDLGLTRDQLAAALQTVTTEELAASGSMATEISTGQATNVLTRIASVRRGVRGFSVVGLQQPSREASLADDSRLPRNSGGAAGDDDAQQWGRLGAFINGRYSTGDKDDTNREDGFDFDTYGLTGGVDYRFTDNLVLGVALGYNDVDTDFDKKPTVPGGGIDADGWGVALYGTWYTDRYYVDGLAGYNRTDYDIERKVLIPSNSDNPANSGADRTAKADTNSNDFTASVGGGYTLTNGSLTYGPYGRLTYINVDIDDYQEKGALGLNLSVDDQEWTSLTSVLGGQMSYAFSTGFGVLSPQAYLGWVHEFEDDNETIEARYTADPRDNTLRAKTDSPDRDYAELGLSVAAALQGGYQMFLAYETVLGLDDITDHVFTLGARMEF